MGNLTILTFVIVLANALMFLSTLAMQDMNPSGTMCYNIEGSILDNSQIRSGNYSITNANVLDQLPNSQSPAVVAGQSNFITDIFNNMLGWFKSIPGVKYLYAVIVGPYNIISCMNLPNIFTVTVATMWYIVSLLVFVSFLWWRDGG